MHLVFLNKHFQIVNLAFKTFETYLQLIGIEISLHSILALHTLNRFVSAVSAAAGNPAMCWQPGHWQRQKFSMWLTREQAIARAHLSGSWGWRENPGEWVRATDQRLHALIDQCEVYQDFVPCEHSGRWIQRSHFKVPFVRLVWVADDSG